VVGSGPESRYCLWICHRVGLMYTLEDGLQLRIMLTCGAIMSTLKQSGVLILLGLVRLGFLYVDGTLFDRKGR
jgi:hypothetical protein